MSYMFIIIDTDAEKVESETKIGKLSIRPKKKSVNLYIFLTNKSTCFVFNNSYFEFQSFRVTTLSLLKTKIFSNLEVQELVPQ